MIRIENKAVIDVVLARAALRHLLDRARPAMLTRDNTTAIGLLVDNAFSALCLGLIPYVSEARRLPDTGSFELELKALPGRQETEVRHTAEEALAAYALCLAYDGVDAEMVDGCRREFASLLSRCRHLCGGSTLTPMSAAWY